MEPTSPEYKLLYAAQMSQYVGKKCEHCGDHFDENEVAHEPVKHSGQVGAGTIGYTKGCQVKTL